MVLALVVEFAEKNKTKKKKKKKVEKTKSKMKEMRQFEPNRNSQRQFSFLTERDTARTTTADY